MTTQSCDLALEEMGQDKNSFLTKRLILVCITNAVHFFVFAFVIFILCICLLNEWVYFTWHPILAALGWVLIVTEGILVFSPHNNLTKGLPHGTKVKYHWILQSIGFGFTLIGFAIIYTNKDFLNKPHFQSWHGIIGFATCLCCSPASFSGFVALCGNAFKDFIKPANSKLIHRIIGVVTFSLGFVTSLLSLYTKWLERHTNDIFLIFWFIVLLPILLFTISQPMIKLYLRLKNIFVHNT